MYTEKLEILSEKIFLYEGHGPAVGDVLVEAGAIHDVVKRALAFIQETICSA